MSPEKTAELQRDNHHRLTALERGVDEVMGKLEILGRWLERKEKKQRSVGCEDFVEIPIFTGDDMEQWVSWIEKYFSDQGFTEAQKLPFAYGFIEGEAWVWVDRENSHVPFSSWEELKLRMLERFTKVQEKNEWNPERWMSCLDRIEKLLLPEERKNQNLDAEEKEIASLGCEEELIGFVNTERKGTHQQGEEKQSEAEMDKNACQVFDEMTLRGKVVTKKRKKKRWKASLEIQEGLEKHLSSEEKKRTPPSWIKVRNGFGAKGEQRDVTEDIYACQVLDKMSMVQKRATRKRKMKEKFTKVKRSKYKCGKVNTLTRQYQEEYKFRKQNDKSSMKRRKLVNCLVSYNHKVSGKRLMRRSTKKKKKQTRLEKHEKECIKPNQYGDHYAGEGKKHELVFAKLLWGHEPVLKKLARWKKHKFKQKLNKYKEKTKARLSRYKIVNLWDSKLEPELFRKNFSGCSESVYLWFDKLLQLTCLVQHKKKMVCREFCNFKYKRKKVDQEKITRFVKKNKFNGRKTWGVGELQGLEVKATLLRKQTVNLWNPKLEPELFEKGFNEWFKKKHGYKRDDRLLQLSGLLMQNRKLLAAKTRKRTRSKFKRLDYGKPSSLVTNIWTRFSMQWKKQKANYKYRKKHKARDRKRSSGKQDAFSLNSSLKLKCSEKHLREGCKYKPWKGYQLHFQSHMKRDFKNQNMRRMKGSKRVEGCCIVLDELLLWESRVKKEKSKEDTYAESKIMKWCCCSLNFTSTQVMAKASGRVFLGWSKYQQEAPVSESFHHPRVKLLITIHYRGIGMSERRGKVFEEQRHHKEAAALHKLLTRQCQFSIPQP